MAMTFPKDALLIFGGNKVTDHNRSDLDIDVERIETSVELANGSIRTYHRADKHTFNVSWEFIPSLAAETVDGFWGGKNLYDFYLANTGTFTLGVTNKDTTVTNFVVKFESFDKAVVKRWGKEYWDISVTLREV